MIINGVDRRFFMGTGAAMKIADRCPNGDIARLGDVFDGRMSRELFETLAVSACAMNEDYIAVKGLKAEPLKKLEVLLLPPVVLLSELQEEILQAYKAGMMVSVEAEPAKDKDPKNAESAATADR